MNLNCPTYQQKLEELKTLHNEFQKELEVFKTTRKAENIWETRKKMEEVIDYFEEEGIPKAKPFSQEELDKYEKSEVNGILLNEKTTWKEISRFSKTPNINVNLTNIPQEFKVKIKKWKQTLTDKSSEFNYPNLQTVGGYLYVEEATTFHANSLQTVGGYLYAYKATTFHADSLQTVKGNLYVNNVTTFQAPRLTKVDAIVLTRSKIKDEDIDLPEGTRGKIKWR